MTEEQLEKINWLNRAFHAEKNAKAWLAKLERDRSIAERLGSSLGGGLSGGESNSTEAALLRLAETEQKTREKLIELMQIREQITQAIEAVEDYDLQTILIRHYLAYETFETIAEKMHYEKRTIQRKHKAALEKMSLNVTLKV